MIDVLHSSRSAKRSHQDWCITAHDLLENLMQMQRLYNTWDVVSVLHVTVSPRPETSVEEAGQWAYASGSIQIRVPLLMQPVMLASRMASQLVPVVHYPSVWVMCKSAPKGTTTRLVVTVFPYANQHMSVSEDSVSVDNYTQAIKDGYHVDATWFARYIAEKAKI